MSPPARPRGRKRVRAPGGAATPPCHAPSVTPRGTDWSLALLVAAGVATGLATWFAGSPGWARGVRGPAGGGGAAGGALALVLVVKLRRVLPRLRERARRDPEVVRGLAALAFVAIVLVNGLVWS